MHKLKDDSLNTTDLYKKNVWQMYFTTGILLMESTAILLTSVTMLFIGHKLKVKTRLFASLSVFIICLLMNILLVKINIEACKLLLLINGKILETIIYIQIQNDLLEHQTIFWWKHIREF